eukprot:TRINITY_DN505_c0_g1_i2.p1 TRINITY_DN505_c0_g1~~TRINITY_DN505_c0_g1_i2.p1  ORF type:complete len:208 (+),score=35.49 TRINITY_DN505_c0_g1_i2:117-740(+)
MPNSQASVNEDGGATVSQPLFGGAMSVVIPSRFKDVSQLREIPDNQEVLCDPSTDQSLIIELLAYDVSVRDDTAIQYHFAEVANANDAPLGVHSTILSSQPLTLQEAPNFPSTAFRAALVGQQLVSKFNEAARNMVTIYMSLIRLPDHETDILITLNEPVAISAESSSARAVIPTVGTQSSITSSAAEVMRLALLTLKVNDWSLFNA